MKGNAEVNLMNYNHLINNSVLYFIHKLDSSKVSPESILKPKNHNMENTYFAKLILEMGKQHGDVETQLESLKISNERLEHEHKKVLSELSLTRMENSKLYVRMEEQGKAIESLKLERATLTERLSNLTEECLRQASVIIDLKRLIKIKKK